MVRDEQCQTEKGGASDTLAPQVVFDARSEIAAVETPEAVERYMVDLVAATRRPAQLSEELGKWIQVGASPRGTLALDRASRALAWLDGRTMVTPDDVRDVLHDCLRHRLMLSYEASADGIGADEIVSALVKLVAVV